MGYQTPNVTGQGGYGGGGGILGFLSQGLKGYEDAHKLREDEKQQKVENKQKADTAAETQKLDESTIQHNTLENVAAQATADRLKKQDATTTAQTTYDNVVNQAVKFPEITKDPTMMAGFLAAANVLGKPVVRNKDGSVNWDAMNPKQFSDLSVDEKARYQAMNPDDRNLAMKGIGGIPPRFLKVGATYTPEQQAKLTTAAASGTRAATDQRHKDNIDRMNNTKLGFTDRLTAAKTAYSEAQTSTERDLASARIHELNAQAARAGAEASAIGPKLQIAEGNLNIRSQELGVQLARLQYDTSPTSLKNLHSATVALDENTNRAQGELTAAEQHLATYLATKTGNPTAPAPDDAIGQQLQANISRLNNVVYTATQQSNKARSALVGHEFQGKAITAQAGGRRSTIMPRRGAASGGTAEGATSVSRSGKPMVFKNGQWEYKT